MIKTVIAVILVLATILLAAGCQENGDSAQDGGIRIRTDGKLPAGFPKADLKPYPGSQINTATVDEDASMCVMKSTDATQQVLDFYADHFGNRGYTPGESKDIGMGQMVKYTGPAGEVSLTAVDQDGSTLINLVLSKITPAEEITPEEAGIEEPPLPVLLPAGFPTDVLPEYPDWRLISANLDEKQAEMFFNTKDTPAAILKFYEDHFNSLGMKRMKDVEVRKMRYLAFLSEKYAVGMVLQPLTEGKNQCRVTYEFDMNINTVPAEKYD